MLQLLAKAASYRPTKSTDGQAIELPKLQINKTVRINARHCNRYNSLCNWSAGIASVIHPSYMQVLSLPMQLKLMVTPPFPFKPLGLVHLSNSIEVIKLPEQQSTLDLAVSFGDLFWHKKGWVFSVISTAHVDGKLALSAASFYLARQPHDNNNQSHNKAFDGMHVEKTSLPLGLDDRSQALNKEILFSSKVGRQYASVSGDYNPIHLSAYTAKLLGFRKAIAHGMFSKAYCLSAIIQNVAPAKTKLLGAFNIQADFMQPLYLPSEATLVVAVTQKGDTVADNASLDDRVEYRLASHCRGKTRDYLRGVITYPFE